MALLLDGTIESVGKPGSEQRQQWAKGFERAVADLLSVAAWRIRVKLVRAASIEVLLEILEPADLELHRAAGGIIRLLGRPVPPDPRENLDHLHAMPVACPEHPWARGFRINCY